MPWSWSMFQKYDNESDYKPCATIEDYKKSTRKLVQGDFMEDLERSCPGTCCYFLMGLGTK